LSAYNSSNALAHIHAANIACIICIRYLTLDTYIIHVSEKLLNLIITEAARLFKMNAKEESDACEFGNSLFDQQNALADKILQTNGISCIHKVTRAGATTSLVKRCVDQGKKVVILVPTIKIMKEIRKKVPAITTRKPNIIQILSNADLCRQLGKNPNLKFQFKPLCYKCNSLPKTMMYVF
jgi:hypothetical protein